MMDETLEKGIERLLNCHCRENASNTPDFILAAYLMRCLEAFEKTSVRREAWFGRHLSINGIDSPDLAEGCEPPKGAE